MASDDPLFLIPDQPMTADEVMLVVEAYFAAGHGNPNLLPHILDHFQRKREIVHAVLISLDLEKVTMYRKRRSDI